MEGAWELWSMDPDLVDLALLDSLEDKLTVLAWKCAAREPTNFRFALRNAWANARSRLSLRQY